MYKDLLFILYLSEHFDLSDTYMMVQNTLTSHKHKGMSNHKYTNVSIQILIPCGKNILKMGWITEII